MSLKADSLRVDLNKRTTKILRVLQEEARSRFTTTTTTTTDTCGHNHRFHLLYERIEVHKHSTITSIVSLQEPDGAQSQSYIER